MAMPIITECYSPSLKDKLKSSICCFPVLDNLHHEILDEAAEGRKSPQTSTPRSSPYAWLKSTAHDLEIKDRCRGLIGKRGRNRKRHRSADFSYDPASYSLNFEDENGREDEVPLNNFVSRLPATPERFPAEKWVAGSPVSMTVLVAWS